MTVRLRFSDLRAQPGLLTGLERLGEACWPGFLLHGDVRSWHLLPEEFPSFQTALLDPLGEPVAAGHCVPLSWDGTIGGLPSRIEEIIARASADLRSGRVAGAISALAVLVRPDMRGRGLSRAVLERMKILGSRRSCTCLIAPVRPVLKERWPLASMEAYAGWRDAEGAPVDPWIRTHWRMGASILAVAPDTLTVTESVAGWESWTGLSFPASGSYCIPGGLQPLEIDLEADRGTYRDPNLWMVHRIDASTGLPEDCDPDPGLDRVGDPPPGLAAPDADPGGSAVTSRPRPWASWR
jgi:hypothetical protein